MINLILPIGFIQPDRGPSFYSFFTVNYDWIGPLRLLCRKLRQMFI